MVVGARGLAGRLAGADRVLASGVDTALDVAVCAFAGWTLLYQVFLVAGWPVEWSVGLDVAVVVACVVVVPRLRRRVDRSVPSGWGHTLPGLPRPGWKTWVLVAVALAAAVAFGLRFEAPWGLTWVLWAVAAVGGLAVAARWQETPGPRRRDDQTRPVRPAHSILALVLGAGAAVLSACLVRPNPDDAHYVNISTWIAQHGGPFPLRDTLYSDLRFPALFWPPVDSYPKLVGVLARVLHVPAPDVVYLFVPPVASLIAVLALWRLLRSWAVRPIWLALPCSLVFLLWNATGPEQIGNNFVGRIWQGKMLLLCIIVPLLFVYLQRFAHKPSRHTAVLLLAVGVAGVGLSTSAMFLVPAIAVAGVVPLVRRAPLHAAGGLLAAGAYPLAAGVVTKLLDGYVPNTYNVFQADPDFLAHYLQGGGVQAGVFLAAGLLGWLVIRDPVGRVSTGAVAALLAVAFAPGVAVGLFHLTGLSRTLARLVWAMPVAALVGAVVAAAFTWAYPRRLRLLRVALPLAMVATIVLSGRPVWSPANGAELAAPQWKWSRADLADARRIIAHSGPGDQVLGPHTVNWAIPTIDSRVKVVGVRDYYVRSFDDVEGFHAGQRWLLSRFVRGELSRSRFDEVGGALRSLHVTSVCVWRADRDGAAVLRAHGYRLGYDTPRLHCYVPRHEES